MSDVVLIVDDSLTVRMDLAEAFEAGGFRTLLCATLAEARVVLAREPAGAVGAVILDVLLPDGDGVELLKELRAAPAHAALPILMLSTEADVKDRIRGLQTGANEYVGKPYDAGYVVAKMRALIGGHAPLVTGAPTVLLIDDSPTFREALRTAFEGAGYHVLTAESGEEGLRLAAGRRPGVIVVDGVLPGIDGATVIRRVRLDAALRDVPCLLLTASEIKGAELQALDSGADDFARKEEDVTVILVKLAALFRRAALGPAADGATSILGPKKILAVDDSVTYLHQLAEALRGEGHEVILAHSGEEALELLAVQPVDCILLDLLMPGLGGQETCRRIKAAPITRDVPLVMLTSLEDRQSMLNGLGAGADDYIQKSSDLEILRARVRAQLRRKQFEDETRRFRERLLQKEVEAAESRTAVQLVQARASLVEELEQRVAERTADLAKANADLRREIEERTRAEAALRTTEEQFRQAQKMEAVGQLAGGVAHDFNNLLAVILSTAQLAEADLPPGSRLREDLGQIGEAALRASHLTKQLLAFSRKQLLRPKVINLNAVLRDMDRMLRRVISEAIEIVTVTEPDLGRVLADPGQIEQVILNLVVNARDAMPGGGKITLETANVILDEAFSRDHLGVTAGPHVMLAVSDTGHGMDPATKARIFEPFFTTKGPGQGTGLGLATVFGIVKQSEGSIWVYTELDRGTAFKIYLPAVDRIADADIFREPPVATRGTETILLVEDDPMVRSVARRILAHDGYRVFEAPDADTAIRLCGEYPETIHLLLTDVVLTKASGPLLANRLLAMRTGMKVLFMSGYTDNAIVHHGVLDPGTNFIEKPFTPGTLAGKVREVLDR
jgi:DNA-binding response OmpR family regulator